MKHTLHQDAGNSYALPRSAYAIPAIRTNNYQGYLVKVLLFVAASLLVLAPKAHAQKKTALELRRAHDAREAREAREQRERKEASPILRDGKGVSKTTKGREAAKGEIDFSARAAWERQHPSSLNRRRRANEEDENDLVLQKFQIDPQLVKQKHTAPMMMTMMSTPAPDMPTSSSASDSFQAVSDDGTSIPPDTHGAVDSNYVVTATNTAVRIQTKTHTSISQVTLDGFWSTILPSGGSFDPRVHYDPISARWIVVAVSGGGSTSSSILIAISKTSNPTAGWWQYKVASNNGGNSWLDYPNVGYNGKWLVVTGNYFTVVNDTFKSANAWFFNYANLKSGGSATYTSINQTSAFSLCPTLTYSSAMQSMFIVDHYNYTVGAVRLWKVTGAVGSETMTQIAIPNSAMPWAPQGAGGSDFAPQLGSTNKIQNNDHRINQMTYINGKLWFSHAIFLPTGTPTRSAIQWWQIDTTGTPLQVGRVDDASGTYFYSFPSLAVNTNDDALIGFSTFSANSYPSASYAVRLHTDAADSIRTPVTYRAGKNSYYKTYGGGRNRWGDYSGACVDPSNMTDFWTVQEASAATVNTWDTWWAKIPMASCSVAAITGTGTMCVGKTTTLADATSGGTWSTGSSIVSVGSSTGVVTGNSAGTATVTYTVSGGCTATTVVTVNANPAAITGSTNVCLGATTTLGDATTGGTWGSANPAIASITSAGVVTGVSVGSTTITYYLSTGCYQTMLMQVNGAPAAISGTATLCVGATTSLSNTTTGGTWSSSTTGIATINATSGVVTGVAAGTATISYTVGSGCVATKVVTVSATPAAIGGNTTVCAGSTTTLTNTVTGGSWFSANTSIATVGSSTGVVTGVANGSTTISYIMPGGCLQTAFVMVNQTPPAITGGNSVCVGSTITLGETPTGGTWSSSNTGVATIGPYGNVTGITAGTSNISYTESTGCKATMIVSVVSQPAVITGVTNACVGGTTTLSDGTTGGSWSSSDVSVATISSAGVVTGVSAATATITYSLGSGCSRTIDVTISSAPAAITGAAPVCVGATVTLTDATAGGSWTSSVPTTATVGSATGIVTGVSAGTTVISYVLSGGCKSTTVVTVLAMPPAISGTLVVCQGSTVTLTSTTGGSWISSNSDVAAIGTSGVVTGGAAGTATITYMLANGCFRTAVVTVNATPVISGTPLVCVGATTSLTSSITGAGTWTSSSTAASVNATSGVVTGAAAGTTIITFTTAATGCKGFMVVTVNPIPAAITGAAVVCEGGTTTFADATTGGVWTTSNTAVMWVDASGVATGVGAGTATISYTIATGCSRSVVVTVNTAPAPISGTTTLCAGTTTSLTSSPAGGTWSSASTAIATVNSTTGVVTGVAGGSTTITYKLSTGCYQTTSILVNPGPAAITGSSSVCIGNTITLTDATTGGAWSTASSNASISPAANVCVVTGLTAGTATITYTLSSGCVATKVVTVSTQAIITGGTALCVGGTTSLAGSPTGGTWSSMSTAIATVGTTTGVVTGVSAGSTAITYALNAGCMQTAWVMVNAAPAAIGGTATVCAGGTTTLTNAISGGSWSSTASNITIDAETGVVAAIGAGTATVTYAMGSCTATKVVTVNATPTIASGMTVCTGSTATFSATPTGGTWSSGNTAVATIVSTTGVMTGVSAGSALITYKITSTGCSATSYASVNPSPSAITGTAAVCVGSTTTLTDSTTGGIWTTTATNISLDYATGLVTGLTAGTATVTYTLGTSCRVTKVVTVNANPAAITGNTTVCVGSTTALTSTTTGGTWSSANTAIATVSASGVVTGVSAGSTAISYKLTTGCYQVAYVMVNPVPTAITGGGTVCVSSTITLSDDMSGGTWSSTSANVTVGSATGTVTGVNAGTAFVTYTVGTGCRTMTIITVNALPAVITGTLATCVGSTTFLSDGTTGGSWSSGDVTIAAFGTSGGTLTGINAGAVTVSYTLTTGCSRTAVVTVNPVPVAISGVNNLCVGSTTTLTDATPGGSWSSSMGVVASVGSATGVVTAVASGVANISYTIAGGCRTVMPFTVNAMPTAITGTMAVCAGANTTLASSPAGGSWISSDATVATVGTSGIVTGGAAGSATITYMLASGCMRTANITVNSTPVISGTATVCAGATTTLSSSVSGGTWTSSNGYAGVNATTGVVNGASAGTSIITYSLSTGCKAYQVVTVNATPTAITGITSFCLNTTTSLSSTPTGGSWISSDPAIAYPTSTGTVYGMGVGTATVSYVLSTGCMRTVTVTVNALPVISGSSFICAAGTTTLTATPTGGTWSSSSVANATVSTAGVVTGVAAGSVTITYTAAGTACKATQPMTVGGQPGVIGGSLSVCSGSTTTLTDTVAGGSWSVANTTTATIDATSGVVMGGVAGTTTVTYTIGTGCFRTATLTVNALPAAITGTASACSGSTTVLNNTATGVWSSSDPSVATVNASHVVTGISAGWATITFALNTGCIATTVVTINPLPSPITGTSVLCTGSTLTLSDSDAGGSWSSGATSIATVGSDNGVVAGVYPGNATISYTFWTGCRTTTIVTVTSLAAITGVTNACVGMTTTLGNTATGGTWSSSDGTIATVGSTGIVTGVSAGSVTITYMLSSGCFRTTGVTINAIPSTIIGGGTVCAGATTTLTSDVTGGSWSSSAPAIASIGALTGVVSGLVASTTTISYTVGAGCRATTVMTVLAQPGGITGTFGICEGVSTTLSETSTGGSWFSSNTGIATVGASNGVVTGVSAGTATISYMFPTGCYRAVVVTINAAPGAIGGTLSVCAGNTTSLTNSVSGGTWTSSTTSVATVNTAGVVTGVNAGTAIISYTNGGCRSTAVVTVQAMPAAITGATTICEGSVTTLSSTTTGGSWISGSPSIASIGATTGIVTGVTAGSAMISYINTNGCYRTATITVNATPSVYGILAICQGGTGTIVSTLSGGTFSSSNTAVATIDVDNVISGVAAGNATITYMMPTGCFATAVATVNATPAPITGMASTYVGGTTSLSDATTGGSWSSSDPGTASVDASGVVTGMATGSAVISYTLTSGCAATVLVNVSPVSGISGTLTVCEGNTTALSNGVGGGVWSSGNPTVASVDASGVVTGNAAGTADIFYTTSGGFTSVTVTVNALPSAISGSLVVCAGSSTSLGSTPAGGSWNSSMTSVATIGTSGVANGIASGTTMISYTLSTGCYVADELTVNPLPAAITGSASVPAGSTITLSTTSTGGAWTSSDNTFAAVDGTTGVVTGVMAGSVTISYVLPTGCYVTKAITVGAPLAAITGSAAVCVGATTTLGHPVTGGTWTSSNTGVAVVTSTGVVYGVNPGIATISYAVPTGGMATVDVTVSATPSITGTLSVCNASTTSLSASIAGGTWSSAMLSVATIDPSGIVTGVAPGNSTISYVMSTGCYAKAIATVIAAPSPITGTTSVCQGGATVLHNVSTGTWTSNDATIAVVGSTNGAVYGISAGSTTITFAVSTGCFVTTTVTVNAAPSPITGTSSVCVGAAAGLSSSSTGGTWTSSNTSVATIDVNTGVYTGIATGVANITYTVAGGCLTTTQVTVNSLPYAISGTLSVCVGSTTNLTSAPTGGAWSSSDPGTASVSSSGAVTGVVAGGAVITYSTGAGCYRTAAVTVNDVPVSGGGASVCVGLTATLTATPAGGSWSGTSSFASITSAGVVTGAAAGNAVFTYTISSGCKTTATVTVNALPSAITGTAKACVGSTTTLSDAATGGTWSSSDATTASVGLTDGIVTGLVAGTATITYTQGAGCYRTIVATIMAAPPTIGGTSTVCIGFATTLTNSVTGGVWSSSNTAVATISSSTGAATGVAAGTSIITYTTGTGCATTTTLTVTSQPTIIGAMKVCTGTTTTLSASPVGGTWSSSNTTIASIDPLTGVVTGNASSGVTITYSVGTGCYRTGAFTVNTNPPAISGNPMLCIGTNTTLTSGSGGTWSSSNTAIGTVALNVGAVTGISAGTATITFMQTTGCFQAATVTVNPVPVITGTAIACSGNTTTLSASVVGGSWSSSNTGTATVGSATGVVTGVGTGTLNIYYSIGTGCYVAKVYTVNALPAVIGGATSTVCVGAAITLTDVTAAGTWSSSNNSLATVGSVGAVGYGRVVGVSAGTVDITYTITSTGCFRSKNVTVNPSSTGTISGPNTVIVANTIILASSVAGGAWSSADGSIASVDPATGVVTGVGAGVVSISYTVTSACGLYVITYPVSVTTSRPGGNSVVTNFDLSLYPNPTSGNFVVTSAEAGTLTLYTLDGKALAQYEVKAAMNEMSLPQGVAAGVYMCRFNGVNGGTAIVKLMYQQ